MTVQPNGKPTNKEMLEYYKEPSVRCIQCGRDIGKLVAKNCPDCGYDCTESLIFWIEGNKKFEIIKGVT